MPFIFHWTNSYKNALLCSAPAAVSAPSVDYCNGAAFMMTPDLIQPFLDAAATYSHGKKVRIFLKDYKGDFNLADWQYVWSKCQLTRSS